MVVEKCQRWQRNKSWICGAQGRNEGVVRFVFLTDLCCLRKDYLLVFSSWHGGLPRWSWERDGGVEVKICVTRKWWLKSKSGLALSTVRASSLVWCTEKLLPGEWQVFWAVITVSLVVTGPHLNQPPQTPMKSEQHLQQQWVVLSYRGRGDFWTGWS